VLSEHISNNIWSSNLNAGHSEKSRHHSSHGVSFNWPSEVHLFSFVHVCGSPLIGDYFAFLDPYYHSFSYSSREKDRSMWALVIIYMLELPVGLCMHAFPITSERYMYQHGLQRHYLYILITWLFYIFRLRSFVRREGRRRNIMLGQEQKLKNTEFHFASSLNTIRSVLETGPFCANLF
jgi:hypothetical protein